MEGAPEPRPSGLSLGRVPITTPAGSSGRRWAAGGMTGMSDTGRAQLRSGVCGSLAGGGQDVRPLQHEAVGCVKTGGPASSVAVLVRRARSAPDGAHGHSGLKGRGRSRPQPGGRFTPAREFSCASTEEGGGRRRSSPSERISAQTKNPS